MPFSPVRNLIALGDGPAIDLWLPLSGKSFKNLLSHSGNVQCLAFSPDGRFLASATESHKDAVEIWDAGNGHVLRVLEQEGGPGLQVTFSSDGDMLACKLGGSVTFWCPINGTIIKVLHVPDSSNIRHMAFSPTGCVLACSYVGPSGMVRLWNYRTGEVLHTLHTPSQLFGMAFSPTGELLVIGSHDHAVMWKLPEELAMGKRPAATI
ncbi:hypothetical protein CBS147353_11640 [Aspergillus niger]|nr:hypothetical protein CBS147353_11640 [Aspergillus niger]